MLQYVIGYVIRDIWQDYKPSNRQELLAKWYIVKTQRTLNLCPWKFNFHDY
jgi:hypothetical protein